MKKLAEKRARYGRDPLPRRLGALAASLARVASSARQAIGGEQVATMLEESRYYIEWVAAEATPEVATELVDIQVMLALWRSAWAEAQQNPNQRTLLAFQAKKWSDQVLDYSGLVEQAE